MVLVLRVIAAALMVLALVDVGVRVARWGMGTPEAHGTVHTFLWPDALSDDLHKEEDLFLTSAILYVLTLFPGVRRRRGQGAPAAPVPLAVPVANPPKEAPVQEESAPDGGSFLFGNDPTGDPADPGVGGR